MLAAVMVTAITTRLPAQPSPPARPRPAIHGVRQQPARFVATQFFNLWANATSDGLVEVWSEPDRQAITVRPTDPKTIREFFTVEDIAGWADSVEATLRRPRPTSGPGQYLQLHTRSYVGRQLIAWETGDAASRTMTVGLEGCPRGGTARATLAVEAMHAWIAALRSAAEEARAIRDASGPAHVPDPSLVYWYHATGCTAEPLASNPMPEYPAGAPNQRRPYEVLAEFIVDSGGAVVPGSLRVPLATDARYVAAIAAVLPRWRFTPPSRAGRRVSQLVHVPVRFDPVATSVGESSCIDGATRGIIPRLAMRNARTDQLAPGYVTSLARRLVTFNDLPRPGTTARFVVQRFSGLSDVRLGTRETETVPDTAVARSFGYLAMQMEPLPDSYPDEALAVEMDFVDRCPAGASVGLATSELRAMGSGGGLVQLSYVDRNDMALGFRELPVWRDVVDARDLMSWADSVEARVAKVDSAARTQNHYKPQYIPGAPILGYPSMRGLRVGLTVSGMLQGGVYCGAYDARLVITPEELPRVADLARRAAREELSRISQGTTEDRVYAEHEVACPVTPLAGNPRPTYPPNVPDRERFSHEVLVTLTVDTLGVPDSSSVRALPDTDRRFAAAAERSVLAWRFTPALRGGKRVRQAAHVPVILRPDDADAARATVAVAAPPPPAHPPGAGLRPAPAPPPTVFSRQPGSSAGASGRSASEMTVEPRPPGFELTERLERAMQPYVESARATYPAAKQRFLRGLPPGYEFFVTTRLRDGQGRWEQVFVAVDSIASGKISGRIMSTVRLVRGYRWQQQYELPEAEVFDWTIVDPLGREEGNVVGRFLDTFRDAQPTRGPRKR
jgi:outer membrane biosynthesis protein TonB